MTCGHYEHWGVQRMVLYKEASVVGAALLPVWFAVRSATAATKVGGPYKEFLDVALAGFLFHILAEESGVNQWYLSNSHASMKEKQRFNQSGNDVVQYSMDWLRAPNILGSL
jgi:hypothetical protein